MSERLHLETIAIVGVGLIGGSFALALREAGVVDRILGVGRGQAALEEARSLGIIDEAVSLERAAREADLILLAVPVGAFRSIFEGMRDHLRDDTLVTDGGSTKSSVVRDARAGLGDRVGQFVPAHPMAGSHLCGPAAARADLYKGRKVVLCQLPENTQTTLDTIADVWRACGAHIAWLDHERHDDVVAAISHLPHWLSSIYMYEVGTAQNAADNLATAGTGFADFTRVSQGSPEMWRDILVSNREAILGQMDQLQRRLDQARTALQNEDYAWLESMLEESARLRQQWGGQNP